MAVEEADGGVWTPVVGGLLIWAAIIVVNALTSFFERSPVHSDSWWPLLTVWGIALSAGVVLLANHRRAWGTAWLVGGLGGAVAYVGGVVLFVIAQGH